MIETLIKLDKINAAADFVNLAYKVVGEVTLYSDRYIVNGKSIMGVYSLDLSKPIKMEVDGEIPDEVKAGMKKYIVE